MIRISAKQEGFRRCGVAHTTAPVEYSDDQFTTEQLAWLRAEPMLVVEIIKNEPSRPTATDAIATVKAAATVDALNALAAGEERKSVQAAIEARRKELTSEGAE